MTKVSKIGKHSLFVLGGGGTAGHIYPNLCLASAMKAIDDTIELVYFGRSNSLEEMLVQSESHLIFYGVPSAPLRHQKVADLVQNIAELLRGTRVAHNLLRQMSPDAVFVTGGYASVPLILAAVLRGVPSMVYLPDIIPGLAVHLLVHAATITAASFDETQRYLVHQKLVFTGYPVRTEFRDEDPRIARRALNMELETPTLLVIGGSQGARPINHAILTHLEDYLQHAQVIHIIGRRGAEEEARTRLAQIPRSLQSRYHWHTYLHTQEIVLAFQAASLVIGRSGASVLGELPAIGRPAVLIPYPFTDQEANARFLVQAGAAEMLSQNTLESARGHEKLLSLIISLLDAPEKLEQMSAKARCLFRPGAAERIAYILIQLAKAPRNRSTS